MAKKLILLPLFILFLLPNSNAQLIIQNDKVIERELTELYGGETTTEYLFPEMNITEKIINEKVFSQVSYADFGFLKNIGKPCLPAHNDIILIPSDAEIEINIVESEFVILENILVMPALRPATDRYGDPEPEFEFDEEFYTSDTKYPENLVSLIETPIIRGNHLAVIQICPFEYNPLKKELKAYTKIKYSIRFGGKKVNVSKGSGLTALQSLQNIVLNKQILSEAIEKIKYENNIYRDSVESKNYLIITHSKYQKAADSLAQWKQQLGYSVEIISRSSWTSQQVKKEISDRYKRYNPKPEYFVIIGDNEDVPGENLYAPTSAKFASDRYYACFDGPGDYYPDIAHGRISVNSATSADNVVKKIINYERFPVKDSSFFTTGLNCAQFQDDNRDGYADRRFSLTSEEVKKYIEDNTDINVQRVYATESAVTPLYWNKDLFANGEPLDSNLKKPVFKWDGSKTDIAASINNGVVYVLHRDHGYAGGTGWHMPQFMTSDVKSLLSNSNKLPIIFSINCHTGEFQVSECFAEAFLRHTNGGAAGVVGAAYYSYSGFNDALSLGMFDAIWSNPGLVAKFTGTGGIKNPKVTPHNDIFTMGDVLNQGLLRMTETWGTDKYTYELFHYFGDPAMKIWTSIPQKITAVTHDDTIICNSTSFQITNCSLNDGLVTLVADGEFIAKGNLVNGNCTLTFPPLAAQNAILTISKHNYAPYLASIPVVGGCPKAKFSIGNEVYCVDNQITFTNKSIGTISTYSWDFGPDALPSTATGAGPHKVIFAIGGTKTVTLTVDGSAGKSTYQHDIIIDNDCRFNSLTSGTSTIKICNGYLYDNGGKDVYSNNTDGKTVISPTGAKTVSLQFLNFNFDSGKDSIIIYDGPTTTSPVIGSFSGNQLPNGGKITSTGSSITIRQRTNSSIQKDGFEVYFYCDHQNVAPIADFLVSTEESCSGNLKFINISRNNPNSFLWRFGDGDTSTANEPTHYYNKNGEYDISLIVNNAFGTDTTKKEKYVKVVFPDPPETFDGHTCQNGVAILKANCIGTPEWFDTIADGVMLGKGKRYITPAISCNKTYYVQRNASVFHVGIENPSGNGSTYNNPSEYGLVFNCYQPLVLKSVLVFANGQKDRTINLKNSSGTTIATKTVNIPNGQSRVELDFNIPAGEGYRLVLTNNCSLFRHFSSAVYPYEIPGIVSITGNTSGTFGYYYFLYDWELTDLDSCRSIRVPVYAIIDNGPPVSGFTFADSGLYYKFNNASSNYNKFIWAFGDGTTDTLNYHTTHKYNKTGSITVTLGTYNACGSNFKYETINVVNTIKGNSSEHLVKIYPNPSDGKITITGLNKGNYQMQLTDIRGKIIARFMVNDQLLNQSIQLPELTDGIYFLNIICSDEQQRFKIFIRNK